jgi:lambda family phage minor tail protein L
VYFISRKTVESRDVIEWELASAFDMQGIRAPKRQVTLQCQWKYKGKECTYAGALPTCLKTLADCEAHFGTGVQLPFGGFPGAGQFT